MSQPVIHIEVRGLDHESLRDFYHVVFGWRIDDRLSIDGYSLVDLGAVQLTGAIGQVDDWQARSATFYIQVADIDATLRLIEQHGGRRVMPRTQSPPDFPAAHLRTFTLFTDPAGNIVGLVETPPDPS